MTPSTAAFFRKTSGAHESDSTVEARRLVASFLIGLVALIAAAADVENAEGSLRGFFNDDTHFRFGRLSLRMTTFKRRKWSFCFTGSLKGVLILIDAESESVFEARNAEHLRVADQQMRFVADYARHAGALTSGGAEGLVQVIVGAAVLGFEIKVVGVELIRRRPQLRLRLPLLHLLLLDRLTVLLLRRLLVWTLLRGCRSHSRRR